MAFPTLGILDDFNRADEDPLALGWAGPIFSGERQLRISSNQAAPHSVDLYGNSYWNSSAIGPDIECYCTLSSSWAASDRIIFYFRSTVGASVSGYRVAFRNIAGDHLVFIERMDANVNTTLGATIDPADTFASGDKFGAEMIGNTINAYYKQGAGAWTSLGSRTDSTYTGTGYIGVALTTAGSLRVDDVGGGTIGGVVGTPNLLTVSSGLRW